YGSFKYDYEKNNNRSLRFTVIKTNRNKDIYDLIQCESIVYYQGQKYIIKAPTFNNKSKIQTVDVTAIHIMYGFQDHYVYSNSKKENDKNTKSYTLEEILKYGFKDNTLGYEYEIIGRFKTTKLDELGNAPGFDFCKAIAEKFNAIIFADNKKITFYSEKEFYKKRNLVIRYKYNTDEIAVDVNTNNLKTEIKAYGKKQDSSAKSDDRKSKGKDQSIEYLYKSPNINKWGRKVAPPINNDEISDLEELKKWVKTQIQDEPETSLKLVYKDKEPLSENDIIKFIHQSMGFNVDLKIVSLSKNHPFVNRPDEVTFSNEKKDIINLQNSIQKRIYKINAYTKKAISDTEKRLETIKTNTPIFTAKDVGSVVDDEN
ncbi:phage tail protein, partial [Staphylococcus epidermidis]